MPWITVAAIMVAAAAAFWFWSASSGNDRFSRVAAGLVASAAFTLLAGFLRAIEQWKDALDVLR